ncbi:MAG TPA: DUF4870 domain-containing protein [Anaerolineae bacterium]|nr:DUF4870 domain-containing protein [Anaerolineae bacterium]
MTEKPEALQDAIDEVADVASETVQKADDLAESVAEQASEVVDHSVDLGQEAVQKVEDISEKVAGAAGEAFEDADDLAQSSAETLGDIAGASTEKFEERLEGFVSDAGNFMARDITTDHDANDSDKIWSLAAYLSQIIIPVIVPVLMLIIDPNKDRPFQKYHAAQSLGFLVAEFIYQILAGIVFAVLSAITLGCLTPILWLIFLFPIAPAIYYAYLAYQGKRFEMPFVTDFMRKQGWL